ncbi:YcgJ family protein [Acinetobacter rudis]|uniref:YcgJ family protein n=1 Tax=Acinetobacter rudis TaxID=632955 RepID=A0AAW8J9K4_9GAMM|nr:YcgJ family protein [Acinetobacter rudis]MDQ8935850.1 YcgJ family protein [Acinetobacter rudis]MDQ9018112.1 YcgJ family protein [Acinetobacter rudis]
MKLNNIIVGTMFVALSGLAINAQAKLTSPKQGVLCDQYVCADQNGISKDLTGNYLNQTYARAITGKGTELTQFTYADGTYCDAQAKKCYVDRYLDSNGQRSAVASYATQRLFGQTAVTQSKSTLRSPKSGVLCDEYICADRNGVSKSLTGNYLDQTRAKNISVKGTDATQFSYSDGTFCDAKVKLCYVDRYFDSKGNRSAVNREATRALFGR